LKNLESVLEADEAVKEVKVEAAREPAAKDNEVKEAASSNGNRRSSKTKPS
jgi:hypothetical protein